MLDFKCGDDLICSLLEPQHVDQPYGIGSVKISALPRGRFDPEFTLICDLDSDSVAVFCGKPQLVMAEPTLTEFEQTARRLNLNPEQYVNSERLRQWAKQNSHSKYVPEALLRSWGIKVEVSV